MKTKSSMQTILRVALVIGGLSFAACAGDDDPQDDDDTGDSGDDVDPSDDDPSDPSDPSNPSDPSDPSNPSDPDTGDDVESSDGPDDDSDSSGGDDGGYQFADDPYDAYEQIDRHAAVEAGTAGIAASEGLGFNPGSDISIRDAYNASNPAEDAAGEWLAEITQSVTFFHAALDDDIEGLELVPASVETALAQAGPVIVPDTIKYDPSMPTSYPNGRTLEDPVVDITLAAVLLELGPEQPLSFFADLPLNPPANDVPFKKEFPYLADPH
jgi:hypothetical protein